MPVAASVELLTDLLRDDVGLRRRGGRRLLRGRVPAHDASRRALHRGRRGTRARRGDRCRVAFGRRLRRIARGRRRGREARRTVHRSRGIARVGAEGGTRAARRPVRRAAHRDRDGLPQAPRDRAVARRRVHHPAEQQRHPALGVGAWHDRPDRPEHGRLVRAHGLLLLCEPRARPPPWDAVRLLGPHGRRCPARPVPLVELW